MWDGGSPEPAGAARAGVYKAVDTYGSKDLEPEQAFTCNAGYVVSATDASGFTPVQFTADYWSYDFENVFGGQSPPLLVGCSAKVNGTPAPRPEFAFGSPILPLNRRAPPTGPDIATPRWPEPGRTRLRAASRIRVR